MSSQNFIQGLETGDLDLLRSVPKTDLHNHACLGYPRSVLAEHLQRSIADPPERFPAFEDFINYLKVNLHGYVYTLEGFEFSVRQAVIAAVSDGVTELEMSIDAQMVHKYDSIEGLCGFLDNVVREFDQIHFRPEIGINREWPVKQAEEWALRMIESGAFYSIDLYGNPKYGPPEDFAFIYRKAADAGILRKAHAGEYKGPEFVERSIEHLGLQEIQHGMRSVESVDTLRMLAERDIALHICPTSNKMLMRVESLENYPVRKVLDAGVHVTINTDDLIVFDQTVSEEYLNLYNAGVLSAGELDEIRLYSLQLADSRTKKSGPGDS